MTSLVLLALDPLTLALLRRGIAGRIGEADTVLTLVESSLSAAIEAARMTHGQAPLGVAARTSAEAIEAIELGADESMAIEASAELPAVYELVDRTSVRGRLRAAEAHAKINVAHADKLTALGTLVAGVAHEINNPLAVLILTIDLFPTQVIAAAELIEEVARAREDGRGLSPDEVVRLAAQATVFGSLADVRDQIQSMKTCTETIQEVVKDLRVFARADDAELPQPVDIVDVLEPVLRIVGRELASSAIVERDYGTSLPQAVIPRGRLTQVLTNVLINATHAVREVARDWHRVRIAVRADQDAIAISVSDTGPGIPPHALERIFDPFYTTKRMNLGTGLGLSISRNLMRKMGGDLLVESVFGEGATFIILVPVATTDEIHRAYVRLRTVPSTVPIAQRPSVMVVDDEDQLVRAYSRVLGRRFNLLVAGDSQEAIDMLSSGSKADVVLADLGPSPLDGAHLHRWLTVHRPELAARTVFVTSEPDLARNRQILSTLPNTVLPKPTTAAQLIAAIEAAALH